MNRAIASDPAENFNRLAEHIDGLEPDQVETELATMLDDGVQSRENPFLRILVSPEAQEAGGDASPGVRLLESVESAIGRTDSESGKVRGTLGGMAVEVVSRALTDQDFLPGSYAYVTQLAERAERFTALQVEPEDKVNSLIGLARNLGEADLSETDDIDSSVFWRTSDYLSEASQTAGAIKDPFQRYQARKRIAEQAADSLDQARFDLDGGDEALAERLRSQSVSFFTDASSALRDAGTYLDRLDLAEKRDEVRAKLVYSMAVGTPRVQPVELDPALFGNLTQLALQEADAQVRDYREGDLSGLRPDKRARGLSILGDKLAAAVTMAHKAPGEQRDLLIAKTIDVFRAARDEARQATPPHSRRGIISQGWMSGTGHAVAAAERFSELDFEAAKELIKIGFDLATIRDAGTSGADDKESVYYVGRISSKASDMALKSKDGAKAFELYSLVHQLESGRVGKGNESMIMEHNANHALSVATKLPLPVEGLKLDQADTEFVEYIIQNADDTIGCLEALPKLKGVLGRYPKLQWAIQRHMQDVAIDALLERAPKSQTALLAREVADSL